MVDRSACHLSIEKRMKVFGDEYTQNGKHGKAPMLELGLTIFLELNRGQGCAESEGVKETRRGSLTIINIYSGGSLVKIVGY
jgi:hypothetical protein